MHKNIITVILSCLIGFFLVYLFGIFYFYESLDKTRNDRKYHLKDMEALTFHKKYTSKLHHLNGKPGVQDEVNTVPENYLFAVVNEFAEKKNKILIQGDSYAETLTWYRNTYNFLNEFSNKNDVGLINAGIASYSPSLMSLQLDVLEKDFNIYPNIIVAYFDQSDMGDEICRYKNKRIFDKNGKLIRVKEKKYSGNIFNYTKIHNESEILLSQKFKYIRLICKRKLKNRSEKNKN